MDEMGEEDCGLDGMEYMEKLSSKLHKSIQIKIIKIFTEYQMGYKYNNTILHRYVQRSELY